MDSSGLRLLPPLPLTHQPRLLSLCSLTLGSLVSYSRPSQPSAPPPSSVEQHQHCLKPPLSSLLLRPTAAVYRTTLPVLSTSRPDGRAARAAAADSRASNYRGYQLPLKAFDQPPLPMSRHRSNSGRAFASAVADSHPASQRRCLHLQRLASLRLGGTTVAAVVQCRSAYSSIDNNNPSPSRISPDRFNTHA